MVYTHVKSFTIVKNRKCGCIHGLTVATLRLTGAFIAVRVDPLAGLGFFAPVAFEPPPSDS